MANVFPAYLEERPEPDTRFPFRQFIGKINYLAQGTQPDLAFAVSHLATFCLTFQEEHWRACERIMRYLKGTLNSRIVYNRDGNIKLLGYSDAMSRLGT